jgi:hypothetical protein
MSVNRTNLLPWRRAAAWGFLLVALAPRLASADAVPVPVPAATPASSATPTPTAATALPATAPSPDAQSAAQAAIAAALAAANAAPVDTSPTAAADAAASLQLANGHDLQALYQAMWAMPAQRPILSLGFGTPEGRTFLLQKIGDPTESPAHRLALIEALRLAGPVYQSKFSDITAISWGITGKPDAKNSSYLAYTAQLALDNIQNEELAIALLKTLHWLAAGPSATHRDPEVQADWDDAAAILAQLYAQTSSGPIRYEVEQLALLISPAAFATLQSKSGPLLSLINRAYKDETPIAATLVVTGKAKPVQVINLIVDYDYQMLPGADKINKAEVVLTPLHPDATNSSEYVFARRTLPFFSDKPVGSGTDHVIFPVQVPHNEYRVFYRFRVVDPHVPTDPGVVVSEGQGVVVDL